MPSCDRGHRFVIYDCDGKSSHTSFESPIFGADKWMVLSSAQNKTVANTEKFDACASEPNALESRWHFIGVLFQFRQIKRIFGTISPLRTALPINRNVPLKLIHSLILFEIWCIGHVRCAERKMDRFVFIVSQPETHKSYRQSNNNNDNDNIIIINDRELCSDVRIVCVCVQSAHCAPKTITRKPLIKCIPFIFIPFGAFLFRFHVAFAIETLLFVQMFNLWNKHWKWC